MFLPHLLSTQELNLPSASCLHVCVLFATVEGLRSLEGHNVAVVHTLFLTPELLKVDRELLTDVAFEEVFFGLPEISYLK